MAREPLSKFGAEWRLVQQAARAAFEAARHRTYALGVRASAESIQRRWDKPQNLGKIYDHPEIMGGHGKGYQMRKEYELIIDELIIDPSHPGYREGWLAHSTGWGLPQGHTFQYRQGWLARDHLTKEGSNNSSKPKHK